MNLKEQLAAAKTALTEAVKAEDVEAIKTATAEVKRLQEAIAAADEANDLLKSLGTNEGKKEGESEKPARTLGEYALKHLDLSAMRSGAAKSAGTPYGFKAYTDAQLSQQIVQYDTNVVDTAYRDLEVRGLFGAEAITGNALKYFILGAREDNSAPAPGAVDENGAKPQFHIVETSATATLQKIAGWFYETDELLEDNAFLASALNNRGLFELDARVNTWLLSTLLGTSGLGTATYTHGGTVGPDDLFKAIMQVKSASGLNADAIICNPADYVAMRLAKDEVAQYYGAGPFYGPIGQGAPELTPGIWGKRVVASPDITQGTVLVGNFRIGAAVLTKANSGARIEVVTGDHDDRTHNRVTVIVEERLGLAVRRPGAFVKITEAAS